MKYLTYTYDTEVGEIVRSRDMEVEVGEMDRSCVGPFQGRWQ